MKLIKGNEYRWWYEGVWVYDGLLQGGFNCDDCRKPRQILYQFYAKNNPSEILKLGSECVKEMKVGDRPQRGPAQKERQNGNQAVVFQVQKGITGEGFQLSAHPFLPLPLLRAGYRNLHDPE